MRIVFLWVYMFVQFVCAEIVVSSKDKIVDHFTLSYIVDASGILKIEEIEKLDFTQTTSNYFTLNFQKGSVWFRFDIRNLTDRPHLILHFSEGFYNQVNFYSLKQGKWQNNTSDNIHPIFNLDFTEGHKQVFYVQISSRYETFGIFKIYQDYQDIVHDQIRLFLQYGVFFGALLIIVMYTLFLYVRLRKNIYLYYAGYIIFYGLFVFAMVGFLKLIHMERYMDTLAFMPSVAMVFFVYFIVELLKVKMHHPKNYMIAQIFILSFIITVILTILGVTDLLFHYFSTLFFVWIIAFLLYQLKLKRKYVSFYLFVLLVYVIAMGMFLFMISGMVEHTVVNHYAFLYASIFEVISFSLVLTNDFYQSEKEKTQIQKELLSLQEEQTKELEREVASRTNEILSLLKEKEILLKEVYHRVKNNFQMVIGMLGLESYRIQDQGQKQDQHFADIINRLKSISLVHEYLYNSDTLSKIESKEYLLQIIEQIQHISNERKMVVHTNITVENLEMNQAILIGMLTNEIINNSMKHHHKDTCHIEISFIEIEQNRLELSIKDDGPGFHQALLHSSEGLGLSLIQDFAQRLEVYEQSISTENGTHYRFRFVKADV